MALARPAANHVGATWGKALRAPAISASAWSVGCPLVEDVSEVLVCYSHGVYETQSNPQANRVIA
jgi:hypothetical protein